MLLRMTGNKMQNINLQFGQVHKSKYRIRFNKRTVRLYNARTDRAHSQLSNGGALKIGQFLAELLPFL